MKKSLLPIFLLFFTASAQADLYFEAAIESGGDEILTTTNLGDIHAGAGLKLAAGTRNIIGDSGQSLSFSLGYMFDLIEASNATLEFDTFTFDAIYSIPFDKHRLGFGVTYHIGPNYEDDFLPSNIDFDDALGFVLQYGYATNSGLQFGIRLTDMDYDASGVDADASSVGIFMSNGF